MASLIDTIERAARQSEACWKSVITGKGASYLEDSALVDNELDVDSWKGLFLYFPAGAAGSTQRRVIEAAGYTVGAGRLAIGRAFGTQPSDGATYYAFGYAPAHPMPGLPYSWEQAVNEACRRERFQDEVSLGAGSSTGVYEFDVTATAASVLQLDDVRSVRLRRGTGAPYSYTDANKGGRYFDTKLIAGHVYVELHPAPTTAETVLVTCARSIIEGDTQSTADATVLQGDLEYTAAITRVQLFQALNGFRSTAGQYDAELKAALLNLEIVRHGTPAAARGT